MASNRFSADTWLEWDGYDFPATSDDSVVFFIPGTVDIEKWPVRKALAVSIHRSGIVDSLGDAYEAVENARVVYGEMTVVGEDIVLTFFNPDVMYEDRVIPARATWVELEIGDQ